MKKWVDMLLPVIDNFIRSAEGNPDTKWWNQIANYVGGGSGPTFVSGWITVFMVFNNKGGWMGDSKVEYGLMETYTTQWTLVDTNDIPMGCVSCPLKINDNGTEYNTEIYAGHIVSKVINNNTTVIPQLDWCILVKDNGGFRGRQGEFNGRQGESNGRQGEFNERQKKQVPHGLFWKIRRLVQSWKIYRR